MTKVIVSSGQTSSGLSLGSGGEFIVLDGGLVLGAEVGSGAIGIVRSGGEASGTHVSGGEQIVGVSGASVSATITGGGTELVFAGGIDSATLLSGGQQTVYRGAIVTDTRVMAGGLQILTNGASAGQVTLTGGGQQIVDSGALAVGAVLGAGGIQTVSGTASGTSISSGGAEFVLGGSATGTTVHRGGLLVDNGAMTGTIVEAGGILVALPGVESSGITLQSGAVLVSSGAVILDQDGGRFVPTVADHYAVNSGSLLVLGDTIVRDINMQGGQLDLYTGAHASGGTIDNALVVLSSGAALSGAAVSFLGEVDIYMGAVASHNSFAGQAIEVVLSGGRSVDEYFVSTGKAAILSGGLMQDAYIGISGSVDIRGGGKADNTTISRGGLETVDAGGLDYGARITGALEVAGTSISASVLSGGGMALTGTGVASAVHIGTGAILNGFDTALVSGAVIDSGGTLLLGDPNSRDQNATVRGEEIVRGVASGDTVMGTGQQLVYGSAVDTLVQSGGVQFVEGGIATGTCLGSGGVLVVAGGTVSGVVNQGGLVISTGVFIQAANGSHSVVSDVNSADITDGTYDVLASGAINGGTIEGSALVQVHSGGVISGAAILGGANVAMSGGSLLLSSVLGLDYSQFTSGDGRDNLVSRGGLLLEKDAHFTGTTVWAQESITDHAVETGGVVSSGGVLLTESDGSAVSVTVTGGVLSNTASAVSATIMSSGVIETSSGGHEISTTIGDGGFGFVFSGGTATGDTVGVGGHQFVLSGGSTLSGAVRSGGWVLLQSGAAVSGETVSGGGHLVALGGPTATGAVTGLDGAEIVSTGVVSVTPDDDISVLGPEVDGGVQSGGDIYVLSGGTITGTSFVSSAVLHVNAGVASGVSVSDQGRMSVQGGWVAGTQIGRAGSVTVGSGASVSATSVGSGGAITVRAGGAANGTTVLSEGVEVVLGASIGAAVLAGGREIASSGSTVRDAHIQSGGTIVADEGVVSGLMLDLGAQVEFSELTFQNGISSSFDPRTGRLVVSVAGQSGAVSLSGDYAQDYFQIGQSSFGDVVITLEPATPCFCPGTLILTEGGEVAVERLRIGDVLVTASGASRPLRWIGRRSYDGRFVRGNRDVLPVTIRAGALGDGLPRRDLVVSPLHAMALHGVLVPAGALVNGISIVQARSVDWVEYIHLELDEHDVILSEGAASESFVDDDSRGMFQNAAEYALLYPGRGRTGPARFCAPRVEGGEVLDAIRREIDARAGLEGAFAQAAG